MIPPNKKSILKRRDRLTQTLQAGADGLVVIILCWSLTRTTTGGVSQEYITFMLLLLGLLAVTFDRFGIYRLNAGFAAKGFALLKAWAMSLLILALLAFVTKQGAYFSRLLVGQVFAIGLSIHLVLHLLLPALQRAWLRHSEHGENALILGQGDLAGFLADKLSRNPWMGQNIVGAVTTNGRIDGESTQRGKLKTLGGIDQLHAVIEEFQVGTVYIVTPLDHANLLEDVYFSLLNKGIAVHWIPDIFSLRLINHSIREIAGVPVLTLSETPLTGSRYLLKLVEDKLLSAAMLLLLSPVFLAIAVAIKLDSPGPVFFRQQRAGWVGKPFSIWKFRSMVVHEPEAGAIRQARRGDPRVTRTGAFLRRTSLDELPQLINVLAGDMSLVGPRPHALQHDLEYSPQIADYFARHHIKPGITGLAQVRGFRGETKDIEQMAQRIESDIEYINQWSLWLDISILLRTTTALTGRYAY